MISPWRALALHRDRRRLDRFFARYRGRTLIVHQGLGLDWLEELLKLGGAAGHFRIDARCTDTDASPVLWVTHRFLLPLALPLPLLCAVADDTIAVRHLTVRGRPCHPADVGWILEDMCAKSRCHARLRRSEAALSVQRELAPEDNGYELNFDSLG